MLSSNMDWPGRLRKLIKVSVFNFVFIGILGSVIVSCQIGEEARPNVILIMTDDQGIGDLGCHGNPWLQTPNIDSLFHDSFRFTNFHVSPLCTPTRAAIMTGQHPINNGTWATFKGRASLHHTSPTMAEVFNQNGYRTGMFGKWHLGDNFPSRPTDCGFDEAIHHGSGGIGEISDYWGNDYFDDVYLHNNQPKRYQGYCTDVWFEEASNFIKENRENPFFLYLPTNAPHAPLIVEKKYAEPYQELEVKELLSANFYGMIANIDENVGKLVRLLDQEQLAENTILIFMTDNGTQFGYSRDGKLGWNQGFKGNKHDKEEGGHRVPFFIRWPEKGIKGGKDVEELCAHIDLLPTLAKLCGIELAKQYEIDGLDFSPLLHEPDSKLEKRTFFIHHRQDWKAPFDTNSTCIAEDNWRLLDGKFLYDIENDPMHLQSIESDHPTIVRDLLKKNADFVEAAKKRFEYQNIPTTSIGNSAQKETWLTIQHAVGDQFPIYSQYQVAKGVKNANNKHPLKVEKSTRYRISLQRWPNEHLGPIQGVPDINLIEGFSYKSIHPQKAAITIQEQYLELEIDEEMSKAEFEVTLNKGTTVLEASFLETGESYGAYYVYIYEI
ncbi:MAG: arylsulfatase [Cyclobacteriaceae bacterium]